MARKKIIAGNWKMNKTPSETTQLIEEIKPLVADTSCDVVVCVPYIDLHAALEATKGSNISVGAENCHWEQSGAFTGEISASMLSTIGVNYVIIGHSERRTYFGETDVTVNQRVRAALNEGLTVILCVGEYLEQREQGITAELVAMQVKIALDGVSKEELKRIIIAYEPVWAIGTGKTATAQQANEVCAVIRKTIAELYCESDVGISPLAEYKVGLNRLSPLKSREYLAAGLPLFFAYEDQYLTEDLPFVRIFPNDPSPIDIGEVVSFVLSCRADPSLPQRERQFAKEHFDWEIIMKQILDFTGQA